MRFLLCMVFFVRLWLLMVLINLGMTWSFFETIHVSITGISQFKIPVGYGYLTVFLFLLPFGNI